jgi:hypothetical protein
MQQSQELTVISDIEGNRASLADVGTVGVGRDYDLVPVRCRIGVFHPKIALMADETGEVRATVGSGNLTFGGWGYNNEILDYLRPVRDSACFADLASMLESMTRATMPGGRLECVTSPDLALFVDLARKGSGVEGDGGSRLLHTMDRPLAEQIAEMTEELGGAEHISVVSPFFSGHRGIRLLCESLLCERVSVAVPTIAPSVFDFKAASADGLEVSPVACEAFSPRRSRRQASDGAYDSETGRSGRQTAPLPMEGSDRKLGHRTACPLVGRARRRREEAPSDRSGRRRLAEGA